jgi:glycosyl transferase family 2
MEPGLVTVMVPSYNYAQYLEECVRSAAQQERADVVVVDNGSTDGSPEIAARLADEIDNVRFVRHPTNDGIITSFNRCLDEIRGEYAALLCADDCLTPGSLARAVAMMDAHPTVGLGYGTAWDFTRLADIDFDTIPTEAGAPIVHRGADWVGRICRVGINPIRNPEAIMRSSVLAEVGGYEPACRYTSDLNLWLRIGAVSDIAYVPGPIQALFRQHETNAGKAFPHASLPELEQRWTAFDRFFDVIDGDARRGAWEHAARRRMAGVARYSASRAFIGTDGARAAEELLAFADRLDPGGSTTLEQRSWDVRRRLGATGSRLFPPFMVRPLVSRARRVMGERRRARSGLA